MVGIPEQGPQGRARLEWLHWIGRSGQKPRLELGIEVDPSLGPSDAYEVRRDGAVLLVRASNPRSLQYGVYGALRRLGFAWPRPGEDQAVVPKHPSWEALEAPFRAAAALEQRGWSLEGGFNLEELEASLDWALRHGLNHVHFQFTDLRTFFTRGCPEIGLHEALDWDRAAAHYAAQRGFVIHRGGHGFLPVLMGFPNSQGWDPVDAALDPAVERMCAEVSGKRGLYRNIPSFTQLCLSAPGVGERLARTVADFARSRPEAGALALWLGDGVHNWCQCADCRRREPSALYLDAVRPAARALEQAAPGVQLEFIAYTNILTPPKEPQELPANVVFQFAPWGRDYGRSWNTPASAPAFRPEGEPNRLLRWPNTGEYRWLLERWLEALPGVPFTLYDYYFWPQPWRMHGRQNLGETMQGDFAWLAERGCRGLLSCQTPRCHWPSGRLAGLQAALMWNPDLDLGDFHRRWVEPGESDSNLLWREFLALEEGMELGREGALKDYEAWLERHRDRLKRDADTFDLEAPQRFGAPWHKGVGWSEIG